MCPWVRAVSLLDVGRVAVSWDALSDRLESAALDQEFEVSVQPRRQGSRFNEDAEFDVVVDAGAGEVGAGDQSRGPVGDYTLGVEAGRLREERLAGFEGPSVEVRGVLDRRERVCGVNDQWAAEIVWASRG